jgi:hypothetical protein
LPWPFFHSEMLANKIDGPKKWDAGGIVNILVNMEKCYTKVHEDLEGNWFSVFVELGVRGGQFLLTTKTIRKVRDNLYHFILLTHISNRCLIPPHTCNRSQRIFS